MASKKHARLDVIEAKTMITGSLQAHHVRLVAKNGEPLMHGEMVVDGDRAREDVLAAMVDVLEREGYTVAKP